jgi:hypothetical protein
MKTFDEFLNEEMKLSMAEKIILDQVAIDMKEAKVKQEDFEKEYPKFLKDRIERNAKISAKILKDKKILKAFSDDVFKKIRGKK